MLAIANLTRIDQGRGITLWKGQIGTNLYTLEVNQHDQKTLTQTLVRSGQTYERGVQRRNNCQARYDAILLAFIEAIKVVNA